MHAGQLRDTLIDLKKISIDLINSYTTKIPIETKPPLENHQQAYQVQKLITVAFGHRKGWKIGLDKNGNCVRAPMFQRTCYRDNAQVQRSLFRHCLVESELAIVFKNDLPKKQKPYTIDEVNANLASINVGIEICDSRLQGWPNCDAIWQLADSLTHGGYVLGSGIHLALNVDQLKQGNFKITIGENNKAPRVVDQNNREHPFKNPSSIVLWLVNELIIIGDQIHAGDIITTGSFSGSTPIEKGETAIVEFTGVGKANLLVV